jgi:hypothetical protein
MRFALHPAVRRVLVIGVAAATAAASVFRGGIFTNVFLELGVIVFVYNLPYLLNRAQHIHLSRSTPLLVDLENGLFVMRASCVASVTTCLCAPVSCGFATMRATTRTSDWRPFYAILSFYFFLFFLYLLFCNFVFVSGRLT